MEHTLNQAVTRIRDFINNPRIQHDLIRDAAGWMQLCCSLDAVEDCQMAIDAYVDTSLPDESGAMYLATYGLLQALVVQQDAVRHLCHRLSVPCNLGRHPVLEEIRRDRNASIGHPTNNTSNPDGLVHHFIVRVSLKQGRFDLLSFGDGKQHNRTIECARYAADQRQALTTILESAFETIQQRDREHRKTFAADSLDGPLSRLSYCVQNVHEGLRSPDRRELAPGMLDLIEQGVTEFCNTLTRRGIAIETYHGVESAHKRLTFVLRKLRDHFGGSGPLEPEAARIFAEQIDMQIESLREAARRIDAEYRA